MPMKLATAPILRLPRRSAAISAPASKSALWILTVMGSPAGHGRKERHLVAVRNGTVAARHGLVDRGAHALVLREFVLPCPAPRGEQGAQTLEIPDRRRQCDLLRALAEGFTQPRKVKHCNHGLIMPLRSEEHTSELQSLRHL